MKRVVLLSCFLVMALAAFSSAQSTRTLVLITHDSFNLDEDLIRQFEAQHNATLQILQAGDAGTMINQAILTRSNPLADVLFGVDNTFLGRALAVDLFEPYESPLLELLDESVIDETITQVTPVSYGDVCINYDIAYFESRDLALPSTLEDLTSEAYRGLFVTTNPATSSPGLSFLLTTVAYFGEEGEYTYLDYWRDLVANDTLIVDGWETAYFGFFSGAVEGAEYPLVLSYASSPPFTVDETGESAATGSIVADGMCFRQIEYIGVLNGAANPELARAFVDFMLSEEVQASLPDTMYVFPARRDVELPELFARFAQIPENPVVMSPELIQERREIWLSEWLRAIGG
ncbi:thiamine ABC transporter substrate-binding protein [Aggregatilineales bacterium SYSU G02658]